MNGIIFRSLVVILIELVNLVFDVGGSCIAIALRDR
jgi:hypothetical protein